MIDSDTRSLSFSYTGDSLLDRDIRSLTLATQGQHDRQGHQVTVLSYTGDSLLDRDSKSLSLALQGQHDRQGH